jgi:hypothetical protein
MTYNYEETQSINYKVRTFFKQNILGTVLYFAVSAFCVYLSWNCSTKEGLDVVMKVIYAFFAAIFNVFYLIYYALFRRSCF